MRMWIDGLLRRLAPFVVATLLCLPGMAMAGSWAELTPIQQEALAPLSKDWDALFKKQQQHFLKMADHYPTLTPVKKERFHKGLVAWSKLTPEQRKRARERYLSISPEKREQIKQRLREREARKTAASGVQPSLPVH